MADYPVPNLEEQTRRGLELYRAQFPDIDTGAESLAFRDVRPIAAVTIDVHSHVEAVDRDAVPTTAEGEALRRWAAFRDVTVKGATSATGTNALRVRGVPGAIVSAGLVLRDRGTGVELVTTSGATLDGAGQATVSVETTTTGARANLAAGSTLDFLSPPAAINQAASLILNLKGGEDGETDGALRARVINRFSSPPQGGNANDFSQWALLVEGVDAGFALARRNGIGTVDLVGLRDGQGADRIPTPAQVSAIATVVASRQPLGCESRSLTPVAQVVDVVVDVVPVGDAEYVFDFDDSILLIVASYDPATRVVTVTGSVPDMGVGDRIVFSGDGRLFLVGSIVSFNSFELVTDNPEQLAYAPAAGVEIYAGGPLTEPIREAILNGVTDGAGTLLVPGINDLGPANEDERYGTGWFDTVEEDRLITAAMSVRGTRRASVASLEVDGVAVVDGIARPSDPAEPGATPDETTTIGVLVAGAVVVRRNRS